MLVEVFLLMHPALVPVFMAEFHLSIFEAGLLITIPSLCRLVITIPTGIFADKFGPRRFIFLSLTISGLGAILVSQASTISLLIVGLSLIMISVTLYHPPGMSVLSRLFPSQAERGVAIGLHGASGCIGQALGTISLGLLLLSFGWRFIYLVFSVPLLIWVLILARTKIPQLTRPSGSTAELNPNKHDRSLQTSGSRKPYMTAGFMMLLVSMGLNALANNGVSAFVTTYMTSAGHLTVEMASVVFGAGPLIGIVGSIAAGYLSSRVGDRNSLTLIYVGQVIFLLGFIGFPLVQFSVFSFLMYQFFLAAVWTPANSMVASLMGEIGGGTAYSFFFFSNDSLGAISPLVSAILIESLGLMSPFIFAIILLVSCAFLVRLIKSS